ncbi:MAG: hypothetical protein HXL37_00040 [Riemerella sp.]|nr:hypothetical protein [Riemerella sp.]
MQLFWYHSPVRFYKTLEELQDMTNPQNTQYFGERNPYPLEIGVKHRFVLPMYGNTLPIGDYKVFLVSGTNRTELESSVFEKEGYLKYVTFKADKPLTGRLEIVDIITGRTEYYSNCVWFLDSTDAQGRKFIRVATKHSYNRNLFEFDEEGAWIVTNLPAYCLGDIRVEAEISNNRIGGNSTLKVKDSYIDEVVSYEFISGGDGNILNFIQVHATNNQFFIDGTQRTALEKIDRADFAMSGKMSFTNVKDAGGLNVLLNEYEIFSK